MKKTLLLVLVLLTATPAICQQLEIGPDLGCNFVNIANSEITQGRAVIGKSLWSASTGLSAVYYFKDPREQVSNGIKLSFSNSERGVKSERFSDAKIAFNTKSINLLFRRAGGLGDDFGAFFEAGFGYNTINNNNIYSGNVDELVAFNKLTEKLQIRSNEIAFLFGMGFDKIIYKDKWVCYFELNGDAGITKINVNSGAFRTQTLGLVLGFRYIIKTGKK